MPPMKQLSLHDSSTLDQRSRLALWIVLLAITIAIIVPYITSQRALLGGDVNDGFYQFAIEVTQQVRESPVAAWQLVAESVNQSYNKCFTLPLVPLLLLLGDSYLAFVLSLAVVYVLPFVLTIGAIATDLIPGYPQVVFAAAALIAAIVTPTWVTILQGYPDISAALLITLALLVSVRGASSTFRWLLPYRWQVPLLGVLLGTAVLFRRHFAYAAVAVLGAIVIHSAVVFVMEYRHHPRRAGRNALQMAIRLGLTVATSVITLLTVAWSFTLRALTADYVSLYDSWSRPVEEVAQFYGALYGWWVWVVVLLGFVAGWRTGVLAKPVALLISSFGVLSLCIWLFRLRYTETYYALHFAPFVLLGITAFGATLWLRCRAFWKWMLLGLLSGALMVNAIVGITPFGAVQSPGRSLWAMSYPPPLRSNYTEITQLVQLLRSLTPEQEPIFVVYSAHLPMHVLLAAEKTLYGDDRRLTLEQGSPTDSDGFYPIEELLNARYVVITSPFIEWNTGQQQTARAVFDAFATGWEFTEDFQPLSQTVLQPGVTTTVYQRVRPTSIERAVRFLDTLQRQVNKPLGNQRNWALLEPTAQQTSAKTARLQMVRRKKRQQPASAPYTLRLSPPASGAMLPSSPTFLYLNTLSSQTTVKGQMVLPNACQEATLQFSMLNAQGQPVQQPQTLTFSQSSPLQLAMDGSGATYLLLKTSHLSSAPNCSPRIRDLVVSSQ